MSKKVSPELSEAILNLPIKEKDKLLLRLIKKDQTLIHQLQFKLLENTESDLEFRRQEIKEEIDRYFNSFPSKTFLELLKDVRNRLILINYHVKVTKDLRGELELLIYLFKKAQFLSEQFVPNWVDIHSPKAEFRFFGLNKIEQMEKKLTKLHEDYHIEYEEGISLAKVYFESLVN